MSEQKHFNYTHQGWNSTSNAAMASASPKTFQRPAPIFGHGGKITHRNRTPIANKYVARNKFESNLQTFEELNPDWNEEVIVVDPKAQNKTQESQNLNASTNVDINKISTSSQAVVKNTDLISQILNASKSSKSAESENEKLLEITKDFKDVEEFISKLTPVFKLLQRNEAHLKSGEQEHSAKQAENAEKKLDLDLSFQASCVKQPKFFQQSELSHPLPNASIITSNQSNSQFTSKWNQPVESSDTFSSEGFNKLGSAQIKFESSSDYSVPDFLKPFPSESFNRLGPSQTIQIPKWGSSKMPEPIDASPRKWGSSSKQQFYESNNLEISESNKLNTKDKMDNASLLSALTITSASASKSEKLSSLIKEDKLPQVNVNKNFPSEANLNTQQNNVFNITTDDFAKFEEISQQLEDTFVALNQLIKSIVRRH